MNPMSTMTISIILRLLAWCGLIVFFILYTGAKYPDIAGIVGIISVSFGFIGTVTAIGARSVDQAID